MQPPGLRTHWAVVPFASGVQVVPAAQRITAQGFVGASGTQPTAVPETSQCVPAEHFTVMQLFMLQLLTTSFALYVT
jgi:hypothetical protein